MTIADDIARAHKAAIDRSSTPSDYSRVRKATVTATSPFTISMNGVSIVSPPRSPNYRPVVNDIVLVLMDGPSPYVLEATNVGFHVLAKDDTVATNGSGDWSVTIPSGATLVSAVANGAQVAFPHLHVRNGTSGGNPVWRAFNNGGAALGATIIAVSYVVVYTL